MENLSNEQLFDIALYLDLQELNRLCQADSRLAGICKSNYFWKQKYESAYGKVNKNNDISRDGVGNGSDDRIKANVLANGIYDEFGDVFDWRVEYKYRYVAERYGTFDLELLNEINHILEYLSIIPKCDDLLFNLYLDGAHRFPGYYYTPSSQIVETMLNQTNRYWYNKWLGISNRIIFNGLIYSLLSEPMYDLKNLLGIQESFQIENNHTIVFNESTPVTTENLLKSLTSVLYSNLIPLKIKILKDAWVPTLMIKTAKL